MLNNSKSKPSFDGRSFVTAAGIPGLAGCSGIGGLGGDSGGKTTIKCWTLFGGGDGKAMEKMVKNCIT